MRRRPTTHLAPRPGFTVTPCCDRPVTALPIGDRLVFDVAKVTCGKEVAA